MVSQEEKTLDLLSTFHYIMGALTAVTACIPFIHFFIGLAILIPGIGMGETAPRLVGIAFIILSTVIILAGWALAVLIFIAGTRLKQRRSYNFCLIIAFLETLIIPLGTVLGIITIINLTKDSVRDLFE